MSLKEAVLLSELAAVNQSVISLKHVAKVCIPGKANFSIKHDYDKLAVCFKNFVLSAARTIHF